MNQIARISIMFFILYGFTACDSYKIGNSLEYTNEIIKIEDIGSSNFEKSDKVKKIDTIAIEFYNEAIQLLSQSEKDKKDIIRAYNLLVGSAERYHPDALSYLGCQLLDGTGYFEEDVDLGLKYIREAVDSNSAEAMECLAYYYYELEDIENYIHYLSLSDSLKNYSASTELGYFYMTGKSYNKSGMDEVQYTSYKNIPKGIKFLTKASEGNTFASYYLGVIYLKGIESHISSDTLLAKEYLTRAAKNIYSSYANDASEILEKLD